MSSDKTGIEWTDATWNPVRGCSRVSEGCKHCYAETQAARIIRMDRGRGVPDGEGSYDGLLAKGGQWNGKIKTVPEALDIPLRWKKPRMIFVNSMSDLFHENVSDDFIDRVFAVMAVAEQHTFQVLTKRPERMRDYMLGLRTRLPDIGMAILHRGDDRYYTDPDSVYDMAVDRAERGFPNVWLGVSVEDQKTANERIPLLLQTPAAIRWISAEPLLGAIDLGDITFPNENGGFENWNALDSHGTESGCTATLDWVVVGGESGADARPMHPEWVIDIRNQCKRSLVPFLFKQWGSFGATSYNVSTGTPVFKQFKDFSHWVSKAHTWVNGGICLDMTGKVCTNGKDIRLAKFPVVIMHSMNKTKAGRLLGGALHDGYPFAELKQVEA